MGIHQGPGPRILTIYIYIWTHTVGIDRECNSTEQNGRRRRRRREIERKREKERMKRVSGSNQTTFSHPLRLSFGSARQHLRQAGRKTGRQTLTQLQSQHFSRKKSNKWRHLTRVDSITPYNFIRCLKQLFVQGLLSMSMRCTTTRWHNSSRKQATPLCPCTSYTA